MAATDHVWHIGTALVSGVVTLQPLTVQVAGQVVIEDPS